MWFKERQDKWRWFILAGFIALTVYNFWRIDLASHSVSDTLINFIPGTLALILIFALIHYLTTRG